MHSHSEKSTTCAQKAVILQKLSLDELQSKGKWRGVGESLSKGTVAHACIFINCFGVAASKKLEEGTLPHRDPKQAA